VGFLLRAALVRRVPGDPGLRRRRGVHDQTNGLVAGRHDLVVDQLAPAPELDLAVDLHPAGGEQLLGLRAGVDQPGELEQLPQAQSLSGNDHVADGGLELGHVLHHGSGQVLLAAGQLEPAGFVQSVGRVLSVRVQTCSRRYPSGQAASARASTSADPSPCRWAPGATDSIVTCSNSASTSPVPSSARPGSPSAKPATCVAPSSSSSSPTTSRASGAVSLSTTRAILEAAGRWPRAPCAARQTATTSSTSSVVPALSSSTPRTVGVALPGAQACREDCPWCGGTAGCTVAIVVSAVKRTISVPADVFAAVEAEVTDGESLSALFSEGARLLLRQRAGERAIAAHESEHGRISQEALDKADRLLDEAGLG